jgi:gluconolactonase
MALLALAALGLARLAGAEPPAVERIGARLDALVPADAQLEKVVDGHVWLEGPLWDRRGRALLFSDIPRNAVYRWREGEGESLVLQPSGYRGREPFRGREPGSNGLAFDLAGRLVLCQHGERAIARLDPRQGLVPLVERFEGKRLNSPNDLAFRRNGELWFTDPPYGLPGAFDDPGRELDFAGVFRRLPDGTLRLATRDVPMPNGLAFSPDERTLYVSNADPSRPLWFAFAVRPDGSLGPRRVFHDAAGRAGGPGGPDGLKVDAQGNLFAAGPGGVWIFAPDGALLGRLVLGVATSNVAFGEDGRTLFVTAGPSIWRIRLSTQGFPEDARSNREARRASEPTNAKETS